MRVSGAKAEQELEDEGLVRDWKAEVMEGAYHVIHLSTVLSDKEIPLDELEESNVQV